jgi:hypothetical protein
MEVVFLYYVFCKVSLKDYTIRDILLFKKWKSFMTDSLHNDITEFKCWQSPLELWNLAKRVQASMSSEKFLSRGRDFVQKVQEALVASTFALCFAGLVSPVQIRMSKIHQPLLDFELFPTNYSTKYEFEIVAAYEPDYKIRLKYRDGKRPKMPYKAFSGEPVNPEWVAEEILKKTERVKKAGEKGANHHLLVYQNIHGGPTDLEQLRQLVANTESVWTSIWIISGAPSWGWITLLFNSSGFKCPSMQWLSTIKWVPVRFG